MAGTKDLTNTQFARVSNDGSRPFPQAPGTGIEPLADPDGKLWVNATIIPSPPPPPTITHFNTPISLISALEAGTKIWDGINFRQYNTLWGFTEEDTLTTYIQLIAKNSAPAYDDTPIVTIKVPPNSSWSLAGQFEWGTGLGLYIVRSSSPDGYLASAAGPVYFHTAGLNNTVPFIYE